MILCEIWGGTPTTTQEDEVTEVGLQARIITFRTHNFVVDQHIRQRYRSNGPRKKEKKAYDDHYRRITKHTILPQGKILESQSGMSFKSQ